MSKRLIIGIVVLLIAVATAFALLRTPSGQQSVSISSGSSSVSTADETATPLNAGTYVPYSVEAIAQTTGQKVLFFHAPWCSQCRSIEAGINSQGVPEGITIFKVDYDTNQDLRKKYGVTLQTTFVKVDDRGDFLSRYVAYDEPTFDAVKRNFL